MVMMTPGTTSQRAPWCDMGSDGEGFDAEGGRDGSGGGSPTSGEKQQTRGEGQCNKANWRIPNYVMGYVRVRVRVRVRGLGFSPGSSLHFPPGGTSVLGVLGSTQGGIPPWDLCQRDSRERVSPREPCCGFVFSILRHYFIFSISFISNNSVSVVISSKNHVGHS